MSRIDRTLFTADEIRGLLAHDEGQFLEFKSLWDREQTGPHPLERRKVRDLIAENVAAFANADGGTLVLGVDDDDHNVTGHGYPDDAIAEFFAGPRRDDCVQPSSALTSALPLTAKRCWCCRSGSQPRRSWWRRTGFHFEWVTGWFGNLSR